jgi:hypothetical protein
MEKYICRACNYRTQRASNLERHKKTEKHIKNQDARDNDSFFAPESAPEEPAPEPEEPSNAQLSKMAPGKTRSNKQIKTQEGKIICSDCGASFGYIKNYNRHIKFRCKKPNSTDENDSTSDSSDSETKYIYEKSKSSKKLNDGTTEIMKMMIEMKKDIEKLSNTQNSEKSDIIKIAKSTAETSNKSVSMLKFAMKKLNSAPPIKQLEKKDVPKLITYVPDGKTDEKNPHSIEEIIIHKFCKNILVDFVGDAIIECYSNSNPKKQSMWGTDVARLMFIIKERVGDTNKTEWVKDHNGTKILKIIIKPIYEKIKDMMQEYTIKIHNMIKEESSHIKSAKLTKQSEQAFKLVGIIYGKKLQKSTLKYIASHFGLSSSIINNIDDFDSPECLNSDSSDSSDSGSNY